MQHARFAEQRDTHKTMSDTPETDNAQFGTGRVSVDFARRLERERDAARKDVRDLMEQYQDSLQYGDEFVDCALIEGICDRLSEWEANQQKPWAADQ